MMNLFDEMKKQGIPPNSITYLGLMTGFAKRGHTQLISDLFEKMQLDGLTFKGVQNVEKQYRVIIKAFGNVGDFKEMLRWYQQMQKDGGVPSLHTLNIMVNALAKKGTMAEAFQLFEQLKRNGLQPDIKTYNILLYSCMKQGAFATMQLVFEEMQQNLIKLETATITILIKGYGTSGNLDVCHSLLAYAKEHQVKIDQRLVNTMAQALAINGAPELIDKLAIDSGFSISSDHFCFMMVKLCQNGKLAEVLKLIDQMIPRKGWKLTFGVVRALLFHLSCWSIPQCSRELWDNMKSKMKQKTGDLSTEESFLFKALLTSLQAHSQYK